MDAAAGEAPPPPCWGCGLSSGSQGRCPAPAAVIRLPSVRLGTATSLWTSNQRFIAANTRLHRPSHLLERCRLHPEGAAEATLHLPLKGSFVIEILVLNVLDDHVLMADEMLQICEGFGEAHKPEVWP